MRQMSKTLLATEGLYDHAKSVDKYKSVWLKELKLVLVPFFSTKDLLKITVVLV